MSIFEELYERQCDKNLELHREIERLRYLLGHVNARKFTEEYSEVHHINKHVTMFLN